MKCRLMIIFAIIMLIASQIACGGITGIEDTMPGVLRGYTP